MPTSYTTWEKAKQEYRDNPTKETKKAADDAFESHKASMQEEVKRQDYYAKNKADAAKKEADKDYEVFGSRGDAARKGMEEGRMDAMGNVTGMKKGGKVKKMASGGMTRGDGLAQRGKTKGRIC
jgi:hypothetical protein